MEAIKYNHRTRSIKYLVLLVQKKASQLEPAVADERLRRWFELLCGLLIEDWTQYETALRSRLEAHCSGLSRLARREYATAPRPCTALEGWRCSSVESLVVQLGELATAYYVEEASRIKAQMKRLNPATQRSLFVRYHFKVKRYPRFIV